MSQVVLKINSLVQDKDLNKECNMIGKIVALAPVVVSYGGLHVKYKPSELKHLKTAIR